LLEVLRGVGRDREMYVGIGVALRPREQRRQSILSICDQLTLVLLLSGGTVKINVVHFRASGTFPLLEKKFELGTNGRTHALIIATGVNIHSLFHEPTSI